MSKRRQTTSRGVARQPGGIRPEGILSLPNLVWLGLGLMLFVPPFVRGLYFPRDQMIALILTLALFLVWGYYKWRSRGGPVLAGPLDYAALASAGAYLLSLAVAVNVRGAIQEILKNFNYFLIYWLAAEMVRAPQARGADASHRAVLPTSSSGGLGRGRFILEVLFAGATVVALAGLAAAAGTISYRGAFEGGRVSSTLQYPNSLAGFLTAGFFLGLTLLTLRPGPLTAPDAIPDRPWAATREGVPLTGLKTLAHGVLRLIEVVLRSGALYVIFLTFIYTYSRGAWLVFPLGLALLVLGMPNGGRLRPVLYFMAILIPTAAAVPFMARGLQGPSARLIWGTALAGIPVSALLMLLAGWYLAQTARRKLILAGAVVAVCVAGTAWVGGRVWNRISGQPMQLAHPAGEPDSIKAFSQTVDGLEVGKDYVLTALVNAEGDAQKPYAFSITVSGRDERGENKVFGDLKGKPTRGWEPQEVRFQVPPGVDGFRVELSNYFAGTSAVFRDVRLAPAISGNASGQSGDPGKQLKFLVSRALPQALYQRLMSMTLKDYSSESRLIFYRDALKIIKDHPLLGVGGRGWSSIYFQYQSYGYFSKEVHNHFLQTWVETGTIGFILWLAFWGLLVIAAVRLAARADGPVRTLSWGTTTAAVALLGHSILDFNLSLSAISFYLWALAGVVSGLGARVIGKPARTRPPVSGEVQWKAALAAGLILAGFTGVLLVGFNWGQKGANLLEARQFGPAKEAFSKAVRYDPWTASFRIDLGQLIAATDPKGGMSAARAQIERGLALERDNPQFLSVYGSLLLRIGDAGRGLRYLERLVDVQPFQVANYEQLARAYYLLGEAYREKGKATEARSYFEKAAGVPARVADQRAKTSPGVPSYEMMPEMTPELALNAGKAEALMRNWAAAQKYLAVAAQNQGTLVEGNLWLAAITAAQGDVKKTAPMLEAAAKAAGKPVDARYAEIYGLIARQ